MEVLFAIGGIVGIVGGFSSFSRGSIFRRTLIGHCIPTVALSVEIGLGLYGWFYHNFLTGLSVFLFSWLVAGWLGMRLAKL